MYLLKVLPPAVTPATLPDTLQSSEKLDNPPQLAKSTSGSRILDKIRGRSASRDKQLPRQSSSVDTGSEMPSGQTTPTTSAPVAQVSEFGTVNRTKSEDSFRPKVHYMFLNLITVRTCVDLYLFNVKQNLCCIMLQY